MPGLGDLTVRFGADISGLSSGIASAKEQIGGFSQAGVEATSSVGGGFTGAIGGVLDFGAKVGMTIFGLKTLADTAISLGGAMLSSNASMEQTQVAFTHLLGSSQAAGNYLKQLWNFAATTPFNFPELADDAQMMMSFGFRASDVIPILTDVGDAMAAMGKGQDAVKQIVMVFGQIHAAGVLHAGDMMQLVSTGIPAWKMLADAMHLSVPQVMDMVSKGLIPADKALGILEAGMHKTFGGSMAAQATTFNGLLSTFQDNIGAAWRAFSGPLFDAAKAGLVQLGNLVSSKAFQDFANNAGKQVANAFGAIGKAMEPIGAIFGQVIAAFRSPEFGLLASIIKGTLAPAFADIGALIGRIQPIFAGFFASMSGGGASSFGANLKVAFRMAADAIADLGPALSGLGSFVKSTVGPAFTQISGIIGGVFANHMKTIGPLVQGLGTWFQSSLLPAIKQAMPGFQSLAKVLITDVIPGLVKLWAIGQTVIDRVLKDFVPVIEKAIPVFVKIYGVISGGLAAALKFLMPYIIDAAKAIGQFAGEIADRVAPIITNLFNGINAAMPVLQAIWTAVWPSLSIVLKGVWDWMSGIIQIAWSLISGIIKVGLDILSGNWKQAWTDIKDMLSGIWDGIKKMVGGALEIVWGLIKAAGGKILDAVIAPFQGAWSTISGIFGRIGAGIADLQGGNIFGALHEFGVPGFAAGVHNFGGGLAMVGESGPELVYLPQGSSVYPKGDWSSMSSATSPSAHSGGISGPQYIQVYLDSYLLAQVIGSRQAQIIRLETGGKR